MRGSILCSLYLWIPAFAGMTGESLRNPVPELVEGCPRAFVILANAGIHSLQRVSLWIPAYARMTGESLRNLVPELAEGPPPL